MKKIIFCLAACAVGIVFFACNQPTECEKCKVPAHNPIDCENYNDVFTVFWNLNDSNFSYDCSEVLVCGYIVNDKYIDDYPPFVRLLDDSIKALNCSFDIFVDRFCKVEIACDIDSVKSIINASVPNKCYVKGPLHGTGKIDYYCCYLGIPSITLVNVEDIYFKND